jgi:GWxTD domain-containing protein
MAGAFAVGDGATPQTGKKGNKSVKALIKQLPGKYRRWLDLVSYIITRDERSTFLQLTNDRDREIFISLFWNLRDPSPGTEKNEFKEEHIRRFQYAEKYFKYGSPRKGWQTDMGRIYIILGEPDSKERFDMDSTVVSSQIWSYYGKRRPGLPSSFWIVFWKMDDLGEYVLYDPAGDGPHSLLRQKKHTMGLDPMDVQSNYQAILDEHPVLARASLTLIPDETPYDFTPSLRSQQLLVNVIELPQKQINDTYATNFLKYKGKVDVDYSINFIESQHKVLVVTNPRTGLNFVHFSLRPKTLSAESSEGRDGVSFNFDLIVSLNKGEQSVFEYRKNFPYTGDRETFLKNFSNSVGISDCFLAAEGTYRLSVMLQNRINKEFSFFDTTVSVPLSSSAGTRVSGLMLSKEVRQMNRAAFLPFKFRDVEVTPDPRNVFGTKDKITAVFNVEHVTWKKGNTGKTANVKEIKGIKGMMEIRDFFDQGKYSKSYPFETAPGKSPQTFNRELEPLAPGYYRVWVRLLSDEGTLLDEKSEKFTVSVADHIPGTTNVSKAVSYENEFLYFHILGLQYLRLKRMDKAEEFLEKAFTMQPRYPLFVKDYCLLLLKKKRFDRVLEVVENLNTGEKLTFDYYALKGKALYQKGQYKEAVDNLALANRIYDSDISVLNVLGFSYLETGNKSEAKKVFAASLRLNEHQKHIAALLKKLN